MSRAWLLTAIAGCGFTARAAPLEPADAEREPVDVAADASACGVVALAASGAHTCALRRDGAVWCWGINGQGQTGEAPASDPSCTSGRPCTATPNHVAMPAAASLGLGDQHACAITAGGDVYCWGADDGGEFGDGDAGDAYTPRHITARDGATAIGAGDTQTCSLDVAGHVACSGGNLDGAVGDGTTTLRSTPVSVVSGASTLGIGFQDSCVVQPGGGVLCWGANDMHQIDSSPGVRTSPTAIAGVSDVVAVAVGYDHACALTAADVAWCWGKDDSGQLGDQQQTAPRGPAAATITTGIAQLSAMTDHTCARSTSGAVTCWGDYYGASGKSITPLAPATAIASGSYHDCALTEDGEVWCWGWNAYGQLGQGNFDASEYNYTPQRVAIPCD